MKTILAGFVRDEFGTAAIEYGLIAFLISIGIIGTLTVIGAGLLGIYPTIGAALEHALL
jgi:pilus assembly protein Flp/PilA